MHINTLFSTNAKNQKCLHLLSLATRCITIPHVIEIESILEDLAFRYPLVCDGFPLFVVCCVMRRFGIALHVHGGGYDYVV